MDKNNEILNELENLTFEDITKEVNNILKKYGLNNYGLSEGMQKIKEHYITEQINNFNIHNIENHNFKRGELSNIDNLNKIKEVIKKYFSQLSKDDKLKEVINNVSLSYKSYSKYGLNETEKEKFNELCKKYNLSETETYHIRIYEFNKKNKRIAFKLSEWEQNDYNTEFSNFNIYRYYRELQYLFKEFLGVEWNIHEDIKTYMKPLDFGVWIEKEKGFKYKLYKNGKFEVEHKDTEKIFNAYKKFSRGNEVYILK